MSCPPPCATIKAIVNVKNTNYNTKIFLKILIKINLTKQIYCQSTSSLIPSNRHFMVESNPIGSKWRQGLVGLTAQVGLSMLDHCGLKQSVLPGRKHVMSCRIGGPGAYPRLGKRALHLGRLWPYPQTLDKVGSRVRCRLADVMLADTVFRPTRMLTDIYDLTDHFVGLSLLRKLINYGFKKFYGIGLRIRFQ